MAGLNEFDLIKKHFLPLTGGQTAALGLTDDVALIDGPEGYQWAVTTDAIVAGVHFFADDPPDLIGRKLVRVNLSDLAAKSAEPRFLMLTAALPRSVDAAWLERFALGMKMDCDRFTVAVIGGDTVSTDGPLTLSLTAFGLVPKDQCLLRQNARSGDNIWVSGSLGDSALGLLILRKAVPALARHHTAFLRDRYHLPEPRVILGRHLRGIAHAAMDISDGLIADLRHICEASNLKAIVRLERLPVSEAARAALLQGFGSLLDSVACGGDDYELLFTAPQSANATIKKLADILDLPLTLIGEMGEGEGVALLDQNGSELKLAREGYQHFAEAAR
jgi:thiamine-monophosphate kinase